MPGTLIEYTPEELRNMPRDEFDAAAARGFKREVFTPAETGRANVEAAAHAAFPVPAGADLTSATPTQITLGSAAPRPEPRSNVWASGKMREKDFICPSGQTCRMRPVQPELLLEKGLLDQITILEGLANELVEKAEGNPPSKQKLPSREDMAVLLKVLNVLIPLAVVEPKVYEDDDKDAPEEAIRVSDIDLEDRMAIMSEALRGLRALEPFRNA